MKVTLERTIIDQTRSRHYNIYRREDARYWVLITPSNPWNSAVGTVSEHVVDTWQEAVALAAREGE